MKHSKPKTKYVPKQRRQADGSRSASTRISTPLPSSNASFVNPSRLSQTPNEHHHHFLTQASNSASQDQILQYGPQIIPRNDGNEAFPSQDILWHNQQDPATNTQLLPESSNPALHPYTDASRHHGQQQAHQAQDLCNTQRHHPIDTSRLPMPTVGRDADIHATYQARARQCQNVMQCPPELNANALGPPEAFYLDNLPQVTPSGPFGHIGDVQVNAGLCSNAEGLQIPSRQIEDSTGRAPMMPIDPHQYSRNTSVNPFDVSDTPFSVSDPYAQGQSRPIGGAFSNRGPTRARNNTCQPDPSYNGPDLLAMPGVAEPWAPQNLVPPSLSRAYPMPARGAPTLDPFFESSVSAGRPPSTHQSNRRLLAKDTPRIIEPPPQTPPPEKIKRKSSTKGIKRGPLSEEVRKRKAYNRKMGLTCETCRRKHVGCKRVDYTRDCGDLNTPTVSTRSRRTSASSYGQYPYRELLPAPDPRYQHPTNLPSGPPTPVIQDNSVSFAHTGGYFSPSAGNRDYPALQDMEEQMDEDD